MNEKKLNKSQIDELCSIVSRVKVQTEKNPHSVISTLQNQLYLFIAQYRTDYDKTKFLETIDEYYQLLKTHFK